MNNKQKVKKLLHQSGIKVKYIVKDEQKLFKALSSNDELYKVWEDSLVRFADKLLAEQKQTIKKEIERMYNHFGDPDNCEICKTLKEIINYLKKL